MLEEAQYSRSDLEREGRRIVTERREGGGRFTVLTGVQGPGRHLAGQAGLASPRPAWLGGGAGPGGRPRHPQAGAWHERRVRGRTPGGPGRRLPATQHSEIGGIEQLSEKTINETK